jgi:hypothetical protein
MKMDENEGTERLMIRNVLELQEATRSEVGTAAPKFLAAASFAIYVTIQ